MGQPRSRRGGNNAPDQLGGFDGVLLVDKPSGMTSHDVVSRIRRHFGFRKVGHGGTLDPNATGLLMILIGKGTKMSQYVMGSDKGYEGTMFLGATTDSQDSDGEIQEERSCEGITEDQLEAEMSKYTGDIMQTPPMVSAIKQNGVPLYKLARKGKTVERKPRLIHVYSFKLKTFEPPRASFSILSTKGTYVRTLCADVGEGLGCGAYLDALRRTRSGGFSVNDATPLDELLEQSLDELQKRLIPLHKVRAEE